MSAAVLCMQARLCTGHVLQVHSMLHGSAVPYRKAYVTSDEVMDFLKQTVASAPDMPEETDEKPKAKRKRCSLLQHAHMLVHVFIRSLPPDWLSVSVTGRLRAIGMQPAPRLPSRAPGRPSPGRGRKKQQQLHRG